VFALLAFGVLGLDQGSKYLAVTHLTNLAAAGPSHGNFLTATNLDGYPFEPGHPDLRKQPYELTSFWSFRYAENPGAAWDFLATAPASIRLPFFHGISLAALVALLFMVGQPIARSMRRLTGLGLVAGGALGNELDRAIHGYVIDFVQWHWGVHAWPTFNVADSCICVGIALLLAPDPLLGRGAEVVPQPSGVPEVL
jgi:signal peptidase II